MTATVGERALDWMLRRLRHAVRLEHDLVLVHESPLLSDVGPSIDVGGDPWRVARVTGELTLRDALPEADRLIAIVPVGFSPPMDIAARAYLRRVLDVRADDAVAAVAGRACEAIIDERLVQAIFESLDALRATDGRWSLGGLVTAREVRSELVGAELRAARLDRKRDWELLALWIVEGPPAFRVPSLVRAALEETHPSTGAWLGWALTDGSLEQLCTAGALLGSAGGAARAPAIPGCGEAHHKQLIELVDTAIREAWRSVPARASAMLVEAERAARQTKLDPRVHRLLRVPLEGALSDAANSTAEGRPPDQVEIEGLKRNLHAPEFAESIELAADLARLARFDRLPAPGPVDTDAWFAHARDDVSWADLAYRRVRRAQDTVPGWQGDAARRVSNEWLSRRDALGAEFAQCLATHWASVASNRDPRQPLALHQLTRCVVRRLVDDGSSVFLVVLDGCDLASFLEMVDSLPPDRRIGLALPDVRDAVLRDDLTAMQALGVAVSPVPTVTSHSRRALFAGEIPGNSALDDTESTAANATADHSAWKRNTALADLPRRLFLKGELGATGEPLLDALRGKEARVVAAVFNGVDDALSSKETTPIPRWSFGGLGAGALDALGVAIDHGWCVLVTADHGHTPFVASDRKVAPSGLGQRFSAEASAGSIEFRSGPLPRQSLHLLARFGAWFGQQRRGFHGGAGIEEVVVPLAFLGRVRGEQEGRPRPPAWWWSTEQAEPRSTPAVVPPPVVAPPQPAITATPKIADAPAPGSLSDEEQTIVALLQTNQSVRLSDIARRLKKPPMRASGFMQLLTRKLVETQHATVTLDGLPDGDRIYRYQPMNRDKP